MANLTNIPSSRVPLVDGQTGLMTREWFRFFNNLFTQLGGGTVEPIISISVASPLTSSGGLTPTLSIGSPVPGYVMVSDVSGIATFSKTLRLNGSTNTDYTIITAARPAGNNTLTLPTTTGTLMSTGDVGSVTSTMLAANAVTSGKIAATAVAQTNLATNVAGNGPAFSAYNSGNQTVTASTWTKLVFNTAVFDTNTNYDTAAYRFTPTVAGYYHFNAVVNYTSAAATSYVQLYKNGTAYLMGSSSTVSATASAINNLSVLAFANGTTDYFEVFGNTTGTAITGGVNLSNFSAFLARAA